MNFKKYTKLINDYNYKEVNWWKDNFPDLKDEEYVITEKLHGSNFSIWLDDSGVRFARRKQFISDDENFYRYESATQRDNLVEYLTELRSRGVRWALFGELFGSGVQKEVDYNRDQNINIFDIYDYENQVWLTPYEVENEVPKELRVPRIGLVKTLKEAMETADTFPTVYNPVEGNICEGVVIRPYKKNYSNSQGRLFILKKKNKKFTERKAPSNKPKPKRVGIPEHLKECCEILVSYVTPQRFMNVVSHKGEPCGMKDFSEYYREFLDDVLSEGLDENQELKSLLSTKKDARIVERLVGTYCTQLTKRYIREGGFD